MLWTLPNRPFPIRTFFLIFSGVLVIIGLVFVVILNQTSVPQVTSTPASLTLDQVSDLYSFVPVNEISPLIQPCLFVFIDSCTKPVAHPQQPPLELAADPTRNNGPEPAAQADIFDTISYSPNNGLATYQVPITSQQVMDLFPEYKQDVTASTSAVTVPAPLVIARVAYHYNINQRILLVLMELLNNGSGPLLSGSRDYTTPYYQKDPAFLPQLIAVAQDLQATKARYELMIQDKKTLPTSFTFFDKQYSIHAGDNIETITLADFLGRNMSSKKDFEKTVYSPLANDSSGINKAQNFVLLYQKWYSADPR